MVPVDAAFEVLNSHNIPVNSDTRRWFAQGRTDRELSRAPDAVKQGDAFKRLLSFRSWGNAARLAGWLWEHKRLTTPVKAAMPLFTRNAQEAAHFARVIAHRHAEFI